MITEGEVMEIVGLLARYYSIKTTYLEKVNAKDRLRELGVILREPSYHLRGDVNK